MCGIVGYIGEREAYPILIKGLHRLEYRGYDSAGVALINGQADLNVYKSKGKVSALEASCANSDRTGTVGIAHTRWATHGVPDTINAHPHIGKSGNLALVHNGIIENYKPLRTKLESEGIEFHTQTDTEVLVQLIDYVQTSHGCELFEAVQLALQNVTGAYAIAVLDKRHPDRLVAARKGSPLLLGKGVSMDGKAEFFVGSDATPIAEYTKEVIYLDDEQVAYMDRSGKLIITDLNNTKITPQVHEISLSLDALEKGGYPHFMLKEIFEQPDAMENCIRGRVDVENLEVYLSGVVDNKEKFLNARRIIFCACGTSWHSALIAKYFIEESCKIPVDVEYASEFRYRNPVINEDDVVVAISQSGETADTLAAIQLAKSKGAFLYGVCNVIGSSIPRATDSGTYLHVGPEIGVASTKAFTGQVLTLMLLGLSIARVKNTIEEALYHDLVKEIIAMPDKMRKTLEMSDGIEDLAKVFTYARNCVFLGRGYNYPVAMEGALKLKEVSYIHAEGYPAAEMKHGPIALIDEEMPVIVIAPRHGLYEKVLSNIQEIKSRHGRIYSIVTEGDNAVREISDASFLIPDTRESMVPLLAALPLQLLSYYVACAKGRNVDQPRNLAKSVTVE